MERRRRNRKPDAWNQRSISVCSIPRIFVPVNQKWQINCETCTYFFWNPAIGRPILHKKISKRGLPNGSPLSLSKNHCLKQLGCILQGEYEGAGAPSCGIKCLQKACASRRLRRAAADFRAAERPENRGIVKASKKSVGLFRQPEGTAKWQSPLWNRF